jgi:hypothetical protein
MDLEPLPIDALGRAQVPRRSRTLRRAGVLLDSVTRSSPHAVRRVDRPETSLGAGTKLQVTFHRVRQELEGLDLDDDLLDFREQASAHLLNHQWMLHESLDAALSYRVRNRCLSQATH